MKLEERKAKAQLAEAHRHREIYGGYPYDDKIEWLEAHRDWYIFERELVDGRADLVGGRVSMYYTEWSGPSAYGGYDVADKKLTPEMVAWLKAKTKGQWDFTGFDYGHNCFDAMLAIELESDAAIVERKCKRENMISNIRDYPLCGDQDWFDERHDWVIFHFDEFLTEFPTLPHIEHGMMFPTVNGDFPALEGYPTEDMLAWLDHDIKGRWDFTWLEHKSEYGGIEYGIVLAIEQKIDAAHFKLTYQ